MQSRAALSHYFYRLTPLVADLGHTYWGDRYRLLYAKPYQYVADGEPAFKTQKQLGGRAIVADPFDKSQEQMVAGSAYWGHKDGYNVLYGNWSAKWYGDPQQRIMWWWPLDTDGAPVDTDYAYRYAFTQISSSQMTDVASVPGVSYNDADVTVGSMGALYARNGGMAIWHEFDTKLGLDVNVDSQ